MVTPKFCVDCKFSKVMTHVCYCTNPAVLADYINTLGSQEPLVHCGAERTKRDFFIWKAPCGYPGKLWEAKETQK